MKIETPDEMITAAQQAIDYSKHSGDVNLRTCLGAALFWLDGELAKLSEAHEGQFTRYSCGYISAIAAVRRIFSAEENVPEAIKDLLEEPPYIIYQNREDPETVLKRHRESQAKILEAYRRGIRAAEVTQL